MKKLLRSTFIGLCLLGGQAAWATTEVDAVKDNLFTLPLSAYQLNAKNPQQKLYIKPGVKLSQYQKVIVEAPLFLHQNANHEWELLQAAEESKIAQYFKTRFSTELQKQGITVVEQAEADTLRLRIAVTGLAQTRPDLDVIDVLPAKAAINIAKMAIGKEPYLLRVGTMAQLEDASTGEFLAGAVNLKETRKTKVKDKAVTLEYLEREIDKLAQKSAAQLANTLSKH
ncbi:MULTISPECIES: DUF3313 domain-containing protein [Deefgea]|uniref:DUF3313 family protein n=1 Tax=Deefgea chitinilytica TaxID=570276 RepID=A0ABS2CAN8_9NEIS|nr:MULTISPECIES: DUF3313 domain-containing protein [Deefgea]MBM5571204.1 DUF3313 family protein [Deefgea chitinilytica]MBM9888436.1 DUF3313 domain-containing protein [Deefgea sp. CFH1-16]